MIVLWRKPRRSSALRTRPIEASWAVRGMIIAVAFAIAIQDDDAV